jgi:hypothetical protein
LHRIGAAIRGVACACAGDDVWPRTEHASSHDTSLTDRVWCDRTAPDWTDDRSLHAAPTIDRGIHDTRRHSTPCVTPRCAAAIYVRILVSLLLPVARARLSPSTCGTNYYCIHNRGRAADGGSECTYQLKAIIIVAIVVSRIVFCGVRVCTHRDGLHLPHAIHAESE